MKSIFLISALLIISGCSHFGTNENPKNETVNPNLEADISKNVNQKILTNSVEPVDDVKLGRLEKQNSVFKVVPQEFAKVNFKNFNYPSNREVRVISLKNGGYEYAYKAPKGEKYGSGGEDYDLKNVYFLDVTGDKKKEAIVLISVLSCGGSCDGGAYLLYIYSANYKKPKLLWRLETGSRAYGCSIKSLSIETSKINIELFGRCITEKDVEDDSLGILPKFNIKDSTQLLYEFDGKSFARKRKEYVSVPERNIVNYNSEISLIE